MTAIFPGDIKSFTPVIDNFDVVEAANINPVYEEITSIETWLERALPIGYHSRTAALTTDTTLSDTDYPIQYLDPTTDAFTVSLPSSTDTNHIYFIRNTNAAVALSVLSGTDEITSIDPLTTAAVISNGTTWSSISGGAPNVDRCCGRLTLESGVAVSTADQANKTTLYYTPYFGNTISLYDGTSWNTRTFTELSLDVSGFTASKLYDIWVYDNAGAATLDSTVWTNATTRATALTTQDGIYVKTGATTRRYVGTIYIDSGQKCQDTYCKRYVYNAYNNVNRVVITHNTTASWTYTTNAWRESNNGTNQVRAEVVIGLAKHLGFTFGSYFQFVNSNASTAYEAVGIDATDGTVQACPLAKTSAGYISAQGGDSMSFSAVGYHYITTIEYGRDSVTFYGSASPPSPSGSIATGTVRIMVQI